MNESYVFSEFGIPVEKIEIRPLVSPDIYIRKIKENPKLTEEYLRDVFEVAREHQSGYMELFRQLRELGEGKRTTLSLEKPIYLVLTPHEFEQYQKTKDKRYLVQKLYDYLKSFQFNPDNVMLSIEGYYSSIHQGIEPLLTPEQRHEFHTKLGSEIFTKGIIAPFAGIAEKLGIYKRAKEWAQPSPLTAITPSLMQTLLGLGGGMIGVGAAMRPFEAIGRAIGLGKMGAAVGRLPGVGMLRAGVPAQVAKPIAKAGEIIGRTIGERAIPVGTGMYLMGEEPKGALEWAGIAAGVGLLEDVRLLSLEHQILREKGSQGLIIPQIFEDFSKQLDLITEKIRIPKPAEKKPAETKPPKEKPAPAPEIKVIPKEPPTATETAATPAPAKPAPPPRVETKTRKTPTPKPPPPETTFPVPPPPPPKEVIKEQILFDKPTTDKIIEQTFKDKPTQETAKKIVEQVKKIKTTTKQNVQKIEEASKTKNPWTFPELKDLEEIDLKLIDLRTLEEKETKLAENLEITKEELKEKTAPPHEISAPPPAKETTLPIDFDRFIQENKMKLLREMSLATKQNRVTSSIVCFDITDEGIKLSTPPRMRTIRGGAEHRETSYPAIIFRYKHGGVTYVREYPLINVDKWKEILSRPKTDRRIEINDLENFYKYFGVDPESGQGYVVELFMRKVVENLMKESQLTSHHVEKMYFPPTQLTYKVSPTTGRVSVYPVTDEASQETLLFNHAYNELKRVLNAISEAKNIESIRKALDDLRKIPVAGAVYQYAERKGTFTGVPLTVRKMANYAGKAKKELFEIGRILQKIKPGEDLTKVKVKVMEKATRVFEETMEVATSMGKIPLEVTAEEMDKFFSKTLTEDDVWANLNITDEYLEAGLFPGLGRFLSSLYERFRKWRGLAERADTQTALEGLVIYEEPLTLSRTYKLLSIQGIIEQLKRSKDERLRTIGGIWEDAQMRAIIADQHALSLSEKTMNLINLDLKFLGKKWREYITTNILEKYATLNEAINSPEFERIPANFRESAQNVIQTYYALRPLLIKSVGLPDELLMQPYVPHILEDSFGKFFNIECRAVKIDPETRRIEFKTLFHAPSEETAIAMLRNMDLDPDIQNIILIPRGIKPSILTKITARERAIKISQMIQKMQKAYEEHLVNTLRERGLPGLDTLMAEGRLFKLSKEDLQALKKEIGGELKYQTQVLDWRRKIVSYAMKRRGLIPEAMREKDIAVIFRHLLKNYHNAMKNIVYPSLVKDYEKIRAISPQIAEEFYKRWMDRFMGWEIPPNAYYSGEFATLVNHLGLNLRKLLVLSGLGFNVKGAIINSMQVWQNVYPIVKDARMIIKAYEDVRKYFENPLLAPDDVRQVLAKFHLSAVGTIDEGLGEKLTSLALYFFSSPETYNRAVSSVVLDRYFRKKGVTDEYQRWKLVGQYLGKTQFYYTPIDIPLWVRGEFSKIFYTFRNWLVKETELMWQTFNKDPGAWARYGTTYALLGGTRAILEISPIGLLAFAAYKLYSEITKEPTSPTTYAMFLKEMYEQLGTLGIGIPAQVWNIDLTYSLDNFPDLEVLWRTSDAKKIILDTLQEFVGIGYILPYNIATIIAEMRKKGMALGSKEMIKGVVEAVLRNFGFPERHMEMVSIIQQKMINANYRNIRHGILTKVSEKDVPREAIRRILFGRSYTENVARELEFAAREKAAQTRITSEEVRKFVFSTRDDVKYNAVKGLLDGIRDKLEKREITAADAVAEIEMILRAIKDSPVAITPTLEKLRKDLPKWQRIDPATIKIMQEMLKVYSEGIK